MFTWTRERSHIQKKLDSESDVTSDSDYNELANKIPFVDDILQPFQFVPVSTAIQIQAKQDLAGTSASSLIGSH